jgi:hypothetical protein
MKSRYLQRRLRKSKLKSHKKSVRRSSRLWRNTLNTRQVVQSSSMLMRQRREPKSSRSLNSSDAMKVKIS